MGAGQIGGIATLLDIDFNNAAGFHGSRANLIEGQFVVYYLSHAMMFCVGSLIESHVILTPASCVFGEKYKFEIYAGTHRFLENTGVSREVDHVCLHKGYNHTARWVRCSTNNIALLVLNHHFSFFNREPGSDYVLNRVRYGVLAPDGQSRIGDNTCVYYGWGSRRNAFLIPLLLELRRMEVEILPPEKCYQVWNYDEKYLCIRQPNCRSQKFGALCPVSINASTCLLLIFAFFVDHVPMSLIDEDYHDDLGSLIVCSGYAQGMMTSRLVDRPCGVGFLDLGLYEKFLTCGVDDSRDVIDHDVSMSFDYTTSARVIPTTVTAATTTAARNKSRAG